MDQHDFYKDLYDRSLTERTEINNSLATPIGILTALLAGLYFCSTTFNYEDKGWLVVLFMALAGLSAILLLVAIFFLGLAFSDFLADRQYFTLNDAQRLDDYHTQLVNYYVTQPPTLPDTPESMAGKEFERYLRQELIRNAHMNQQVNRRKTAFLFQSHKFMIYAIVSLALLLIPFGIDFGLNRGTDKVQQVMIGKPIPVDLTLRYQKDTTIRLPLIFKKHGEFRKKRGKTDTTTVADHPGGQR